MLRKSFHSDTVFIIGCYALLAAGALAVLLPFLNLVSVSLSGETAVVSGSVYFLPKKLQGDAYVHIFSSGRFLQTMGVTARITLAGTALGVIVTMLAAYPLSKRRFPGRKILLLAFIFTMVFNSGIVPSYMLVYRLNLLNSIWAIILPSISSVFDLLIVKNYFEALPPELEESSKMDGASHLTTFIKIMLPLSLPVVATISIFYAVGFWNGYFLPKLYLTRVDMQTLQLYLRAVVFEAMDPAGQFALDSTKVGMAPQTVINAAIILAMIPMVVVYPFLQRFFIHGIIIGSVKG